MIVLRHSEGKYRPIILCDECQQPIKDVGLANVLSLMPDSGDVDVQEVLHVHQGHCMDRAEAKLEKKGNTGYDNLEDHLYCLSASVGMTPERIKELFDQKKEFGY